MDSAAALPYLTIRGVVNKRLDIADNCYNRGKMDAVEEVKSRLNIEDVIGEYVELKRAGRNFRGLSPFSNERSPSFMVSPDKQIWHDFSSGKGGNVFSFVMEMEGLDFKGALELLARKAGIDIEQYRTAGGGSGTKQKERLYEALELATKFYQTQFKGNKVALEYVLGKREFTKDTALEWRLGYSPNGGTALVDFMKAHKFSESEIKLAGLSSQRYHGLADMFRGRVMIPLADAQGRIIGFTARLLADEPNAPKYINTPQTPLYDKSRHVYGLHLAKEAIRRQLYVVITEGNLDVIASHQAGVKQVVATAGTAMTEQHLKLLSRFTNDIRLCFDADKAGLNATERAIPIASKVGVNLSIVTIPSGKDPDELIKQDKAVWEDIITKPQPALDWLMDRYKAQLDLSSAPGKRQFSDVLLPVVRSLADPVEQDHYLNQIAKTLEIGRESLVSKMGQTEAKVVLRKPKAAPVISPAEKADSQKVSGHFMSLMFVQPSLRNLLKAVQQDMLASDEDRQMADFLRQQPEFSVKKAGSLLQDLREYGNILLVQYEALYQDLELNELQYEATRLQVRLIEQYVKHQKEHLRAAMQSADEAGMQALLIKARELDELLKQVKKL